MSDRAEHPTAEPGAAPADSQAIADQAIRDLKQGLSEEEAAYMVAVLANRAAAELHRLAKSRATATKGEAAWGGWASLQNAARRLVLDATSARDGAARLVGRVR